MDKKSIISRWITQWFSFCPPSTTGVFNLLSSRANLHLSYNPAGRSHCRLQNHHVYRYIKPHHRGMGGTVHSPTLTSLHLRHSSFPNPSAALSTSQLILQPFRYFTYVRHFTYVIAHSTTLPPLHLRYKSFYNPSVASPMSQTLHVLHLASRPGIGEILCMVD